MKKIIKFLLLLLIVCPFIVRANTYKNEVINANELIKREFYINTYEKYIFLDKKTKFEYSNNVIKYNSQFTKGGFISIDEYRLSEVNGMSYLLSDNGYWTLSKDKNNYYVITKDNIDISKNINSSYDARVTEYVNPNAVVLGSGTKNDPWRFNPMYKVSVNVNSLYARVESGNNQYIKGNCSTDECTANIKILNNKGYMYLSNDCGGTYDLNTNTLIIKNVRKDLDCNVEFGYGLFTINVEDATPNTFYVIYADDYYTNVDNKISISSLSSVTEKKGYTFLGYTYDGIEIVDKNKKLNKKALNIITKDLTINPLYEANKYIVKYDCNGGFDAPSPQTVVFNDKFSITSDLCKRNGYVQTGWNLRSDGLGHTWDKTDKANSSWNLDSNVTLYAIWQECKAGTYSGSEDNICSTCKSGTYSTDGQSKCSTCPRGYTSEIGADGVEKCFIKIDAGKYLKDEKTSKQVECENGYYNSEHIVYYGKTSKCNKCPNGYMDGKQLSDKIDESKCLRNVDAGYYIAEKKASGNTVCENGYYKAEHQVRYGESSSCNRCPSGYRDGSKIQNKVSLNSCLRNVAAGYYIASSKSINNTMCPNGQYSEMHSITYGQTSNCSSCPSGYQDGRKLENKVSKESCIKNVDAGYYVGTEKSEKTKTCANGFYIEEHQLNYGKTSECKICPVGYRDGATVSNKTSIDKCLKNVSGGYYIAISRDANNTLCPDGYYKEKHSVTFGQTSNCNICPEGYRDGKNAASKSNLSSCTRIVDAGYYLANANDKKNTLCANGYYKGTHSVTYGSTSTCNSCPDGYKDGKSLDSKTSESKCIRNVDAGYYIMGSKATNNTECPTGYYKASHSVPYGAISRCVVCPSGYRFGSSISNKLSESTCIRNVPENYYIANSKDDKNTACPTGTTKKAHTVKYGETSSCN